MVIPITKRVSIPPSGAGITLFCRAQLGAHALPSAEELDLQRPSLAGSDQISDLLAAHNPLIGDPQKQVPLLKACGPRGTCRLDLEHAEVSGHEAQRMQRARFVVLDRQQ